MADGIGVLLRIDKRALDDLRADLRRQVVMGALRDAGQVFVKEARARAPVLKQATNRRVPGTVRRNIRAFRSKLYKPSQGAIGVYVTVRATKARLRKAPVSGDPYYWRFLEGGHRIVPRTKSGLTRRQLRRLGQTITQRRASATRRVDPIPFLGPAFRSKQAEALRVFEVRIAARVAKANGGGT